MLFNPRLNGTFNLVLHDIKNKIAEKYACQPSLIFVFCNPTRFPTYPNSTKMSQMSQFRLINKV